MNVMEKSSIKHAAEWLVYANSPQYKTDLLIDKAKRAKKDKAAGHSPKCSLTKCHATCTKA